MIGGMRLRCPPIPVLYDNLSISTEAAIEY